MVVMMGSDPRESALWLRAGCWGRDRRGRLACDEQRIAAQLLDEVVRRYADRAMHLGHNVTFGEAMALDFMPDMGDVLRNGFVLHKRFLAA